MVPPQIAKVKFLVSFSINPASLRLEAFSNAVNFLPEIIE